MWGEALATWATSSHGLASERRRSIIATAMMLTAQNGHLKVDQCYATHSYRLPDGETRSPQDRKAGSNSWGRHQACEDLGSALTSCRLGWRAQKIRCQGDADVTPHERPSRRYFFQASYSDATWHTAVGKATSTCESLGRGTGAPRGVLPLVPSRSYDQV